MNFNSNGDLEDALEKGGDLIADAQKKWELSVLDRQRAEALLCAKFRAEGPERTSTQVKEMMQADQSHYDAVLKEIEAKSEYTRLYERHLSNKKKASLRSAF
jgi:hypothetical protein